MTEEEKVEVPRETPQEVKTPEQEIEQLRSEIKRRDEQILKLERNLKSAQGITRKAQEEREKLQAQLDQLVSENTLSKAMLGWLSQQTGRREEEISEEISAKQPDLLKQFEEIQRRAQAQRDYENFLRKYNSYKDTLEELGIALDSEEAQRVEAFAYRGNWKAADREVERIKAEKAKPQEPAVSEEEKEKKFREMVEAEVRKRMQEAGLIKQEAGMPSASASPTFTREQIADRKFYEEHKEEILKAYREGRIK